jgi:hypothetical protein
MPETLYPQRQRCKTCRKGFTDIVLEGLYCSYRCGKFTAPTSNIEDTPRSCKREVNGSWGYKTRFKSEQEVPQKYRDDPSTNIYICDNCHTYHIGHSRPDATEVPREKLIRYVKNEKELGSVIERYMSSRNIDTKTLAKKLKIPAIRIKEIFEGSDKVKANILFNVMNELRLRIEITSPK